jgi:hypothetical protein
VAVTNAGVLREKLVVYIPAASPGAFDQTTRHAVPAFFASRSCERERVVVRPLAHARSYINQAEASFGVSYPMGMNSLGGFHRDSFHFLDQKSNVGVVDKCHASGQNTS